MTVQATGEHTGPIQSRSVRAVIAGDLDSSQQGADSDLDVCLDLPLPATLPVDSVSATLCVGTCFHRRSTVRDLRISVDGVRHPATATRMPRLDLFRSLHPALPPEEWSSVARDPSSERDPELRAYRSGFWATIPIGPRAEPGELRLAAVAELGDGRIVTAPLGTVTAVARPERLSIDGPERKGSPLIAVCMTTFNPDLRLFRTQIESLRGQTDPDWVCFISDDCSESGRFEAITDVVAGDDRFVLTRAPERLGFYRNFERVLGLVPDEAELVALCDHDDRWYPDKLETLRAAIGDAELAYSDVRLVDVERAGPGGDPLARPAEQPHEPRIASDLELDRRRVLPVSPPGDRFARCPSRGVPDGISTTTGSRSSPSRSATSLTSIARCTTTCSIPVRSSAGLPPSPRRTSLTSRRGLPGLLERRRGLPDAVALRLLQPRTSSGSSRPDSCSPAARTDLTPSKRRALRRFERGGPLSARLRMACCAPPAGTDRAQRDFRDGEGPRRAGSSGGT